MLLELPERPIVVIGAGLSGSSAATILALAGYSVSLFERDSFPRDKLCGEFLSGESARLLEKLGCLSSLMAHHPPRITHIRFFSRRSRSVTVALPAPAFGLSRQLLDKTLFDHAVNCGAMGYTDCEVRALIRRPASSTLLEVTRKNHAPETIAPALTIAAYGRRSKLDRNLERSFLNNLDGSVGIKLHHRATDTHEGRRSAEDLATTTEIYGLRGGYCGICTVENNIINVCMLLQKATIARIGSGKWVDIMRELAAQNPALGRRLASLVPIDETPLTVSQMPFVMKEQAVDDIIFTGDAAGMIAPLCGDGQAMALEAGISLAEHIIQSFPDANGFWPDAIAASRIGARWQSQWRSRYRARLAAGRALQYTFLRPGLAEAAIGILRLAPASLVNHRARITRSQA